MIWSTNSIDSGPAYWVHLEAHHGRERGILVPVIFEGVAQPFAFSLIQGCDLTQWDGASRQDAAADLIADVKGILERGENLHSNHIPIPAQRRWAKQSVSGASLILTLAATPGFLSPTPGSRRNGSLDWADKARQKAADLALEHRPVADSDSSRGNPGPEKKPKRGEDAQTGKRF